MLRVLLILQCLNAFAYADASTQVQDWVAKSALIFQGTVLPSQNNVDGIDANDNPVTVRVDGVLLDNDTAVHNFGSLKGKELTVVDPSLTGPYRSPGTSAVFFVNPLLYGKKIAVTLTAAADDQLVKDLLTQVTDALEEKKNKERSDAENKAESIVTGTVEAITLLSDEKLKQLRLLANGYDLYSEHAPRWREARIRVEHVLKGNADRILLVVFPSTDDRAWANSPKFVVGQSGTWLLHGNTRAALPGAMQLSEARARILLPAEPFQGNQLRVYTALRPEDFRPNAPQHP